jgi:hypothetical protein
LSRGIEQGCAAQDNKQQGIRAIAAIRGHSGKHYAPVGASDTPGGYPSAGGAFIMR